MLPNIPVDVVIFDLIFTNSPPLFVLDRKRLGTAP